ncbi:MAG: tetratricopeptide repeat protein [Flavipsychrobacter sp.]
MKRPFIYFFSIISFLNTISQKALAQSSSDKATAKSTAEQAIKKVDKGDIDDGILMLKQSAKLDPDNYDYPYEIAYAYYQVKDYNNALVYAKQVIAYPNTSDLCYELLGNIFDDMKDSINSVKAYEAGLKKYPMSGRLYLELGVHYALMEQYQKAMNNYEKGIEVAPEFPSNYYRAAQLFLLYTNEQVWGMLYGELFMNLERSGDRNRNMSKLLFETYKNQITKENDTSIHISFTKQGNIIEVDPKDLKHNRIKFPFSSTVYEMLLIPPAAVVMTGKTLDLEGMCTIRNEFIKAYYEKDYIKEYPIVLFDYQNKVKKAGHFDAYNHWLLASGDMNAFEKWKDKNNTEWDAFVKWYNNNPIQLNRENEFLRTDYR